jgi:hypothetical protein
MRRFRFAFALLCACATVRSTCSRERTELGRERFLTARIDEQIPSGFGAVCAAWNRRSRRYSPSCCAMIQSLSVAPLSELARRAA